MDNLSGFLKKFKYLLHSKEVVEKTVKEICEKNIGVSPDIKIRNTTCYIKNTGPVKSQVFINKDRIINEVNSALGKVVITDLR
ncbi:MAG: hypothetical protein MRY49_02360 [Candidatus Pacebacteria bacterium]|nr:hypothetical protein [Candidatus Paceibacterota bacterium]